MPFRPSFISDETWQRATGVEADDLLEQGLASLKLPTMLEDGISQLKQLATSFETPSFEPTQTQRRQPLPMVTTPMPEIRPQPAPDYTQEFAEAGLDPQGEPFRASPGIPGPDLSPQGTPIRSAAEMASPAPTGDLRAYTRQKALSLGIDPDIAERVAMSEGGFSDPVRQSDVIAPSGQRETSFGPYQLYVGGGLGDEAIRRGHDPRDPKNVYRNIDFALEHAAQNGWGAFHGAARVGVGPRQGIGVAPRAPGPAHPQPQAMPERASQTTQAVATAGQFTRNQGEAGTALGLSWERTLEICGPVAAAAFLRATGRLPGKEEAEAMRVAQEKGYWAPGRGMGGPGSQSQLLTDLGVANRLENGVDWNKIRADVQRGNPVIVDTPGHYYVVEGYNPETGQYDLGESARFLRASGGRRWFKPEEIPALGMGAPRSAIYLDNPQTVRPSVVAGKVDPAPAAVPAPQPAAPAAAPERDFNDKVVVVSPEGTRITVPRYMYGEGPGKYAPSQGWTMEEAGPVMQRTRLPAGAPTPAVPSSRPPAAPSAAAGGSPLDDARAASYADQPLMARNSLDPNAEAAADTYAPPPPTVPQGMMSPDPTDIRELTAPNVTIQSGGPPDGPSVEMPVQPAIPGPDLSPMGTPITAPRPRESWEYDSPPTVPQNFTPPPSSPYQPEQEASMVPAPGRFDQTPSPTVTAYPGEPDQPPAAQPTTQTGRALKPVWDAAGAVVGYVQEQASSLAGDPAASIAAPDDVTPPPGDPYAPGQRESMTPPPAHQMRPGQRTVVTSTPGEPDYVPPAPSLFGPEGLLEPLGGGPRILERMRQIEENAAREIGHSTATPQGQLTRFRATQDPGWRARNPDAAAEYDALQTQIGLVVAGQAGDAARIGRLARPAQEVAEAGATIGRGGAPMETPQLGWNPMPRFVEEAERRGIPAQPWEMTSQQFGRLRDQLTLSEGRGEVDRIARAVRASDDLPTALQQYGDDFAYENPGLVRRFSNLTPDTQVTVYRGVDPADPNTALRPGDWIALERRYAADHAAGRTSRRSARVITQKLPASHIAWAGTSADEWIYAPPGLRDATGNMSVHEAIVRDAIQRGERVPESVLAEYPGLSPRGEPPSARPLTNAERVAAADARMRAQGSTSTLGTFGAAPQPSRGRPTVEVLQEQLETATRAWQRARDAGDERMAALAREQAVELESHLADATDARRALEPAIASDVGRQANPLTLTEESADALTDAMRPVERVRPEQAADLGGPLSVPVSTAERLNVTPGPSPGLRGAGALTQLSTDLGNTLSGAAVGATTGAMVPVEATDTNDPMAERLRNMGAGALIGAGAFPALGRIQRRGGGALGTLGAGPNRPARTPGRTFAFGAKPGERLEFNVKVVPLSELITSHTDSLVPNRAFPAELQPRVRERMASRLQIDRIVNEFDPDQMLVDTHTVERGPMIVGPDLVVESGNGRSIALRRLAKEQPEAYARYVEALKDELPRYGLTEDALRGIDQPVLVRERVTDVDRAQFAAEANVGAQAGMSPIERATQTASRLSDETVAQLSVKEGQSIDEALLSAENEGVRRAFMATVPEQEWPDLLDAAGNLNADGLNRLKSALLVKTYQGSAGVRLATAFVESTDPGIANVERGIYASLPAMARAEARIAAGELDAGLSLASDVATAADVYARLRRARMSVSDYVAQAPMFGERETTPLQDRLLTYFAENARSPGRLRALLDDYAATVEQFTPVGQDDLFGGSVAQATKDEVLDGVIRRLGRGTAADESADLGGVGAGGPLVEGAGPGSPPVPRGDAGVAESGSAGSPPAIDLPPAPARPARAPVTPQRPGVVPDDFAPTGGPEGSLNVEGAPVSLARPTEAPRGTLPTGGPEGTLQVSDLIPPEVDALVRRRFPKPEQAESVLANYAAMKEGGADDLALHRFLNTAVGSWANRVGILRFAGMLSSTYTQFTNTAGSGLQVAGDVLGVVPAVGADVLRAGVTRTPREVFLAEGPARVTAMRAAHAQAAADAAFTLRHGIRPFELSKLDHLRGGFATNVPGLAPAGSRRAGAVDMAVEYPLRMMAAADTYFRGLAQAGHLAAEATARAAKEGKGKVDPARVAELMTDKGLMNQAEALAKKTVLQEERGLTTWIRGTIDKAPLPARMLAEALLPFVRTPYNIVAQGVEMTPIGASKALWDASHGKMTNRELSDRLAKAAVGTTIGAIGFALAAEGHITGAYPEDERERSTLPPGWRPFSARVTVGDETRYIPLAALGPVAIPASLGAILGAARQNGQEIDYGSVAESVGRFAEDQTFLRSLFDGVEAFRRGGNAIQNYAEQVAASYSPHVLGGGALGRQIQQAMGMAPRDPEGAIEALMATHPLLAGQVPPRLDVLGRETQTAPTGAEAMIPNVRTSIDRDEPIIAAFREAGQGLPRKAPDEVRDPATNQMVELDRGQRLVWREAFGQALEQRWQQAGFPRDARGLNRVEQAARTDARRRVLGR